MIKKTSIGKSFNENSFEAGKEAVENAFNNLDNFTKGKGPNFAIVFASSVFEQKELLSGIRSKIKCPLVGSSSAGEITQDGPIKDSVVVMLFFSEGVSFFTAKGDSIKKVGSRKSGISFAQNLKKQAEKKGEEIKSIIMLTDVLVGNGADIVRGILDEMGKNFPLVGGASGDNQEFKKTFQYLGDEVLSETIVGVGISGDFSFDIGVRHGWIPIGLPMKVTKVDGSMVQEIDGKPAVEVYKKYFGKENFDSLKGGHSVLQAHSVLAYPFGISKPGENEILLRTTMNVLEDGSLKCAGEIPLNSDIRLMIGSKKEAMMAAEFAAEKAIDSLGDKKPKAALIFNCIARNNLFGEDTNKEIQAIRDIIGSDVSMIGFYTYGEQAPINGITRDIKKCNSSFHNETVVIYTIA